MEAASLPMDLRTTTPALAARVSALLLALATLIAARLLRHPPYVAIIRPLWIRLTRAARRFDRAMANLAAATPARPDRALRSSGGPPPAALPRRKAWLLEALRHEAAFFTNRIDELLADPEAAALIAASPQALRILRPIAHMLGCRHPLLACPRRPRASPAPEPLAPPPAPPRPAAASRVHPLGQPAPPRLAAPAPRLDPGAPLCPHRALWPFGPLPPAFR